MIFRKDFEFPGLMALSRQKKGTRTKSIKIVLFGNIHILAPKSAKNETVIWPEYANIIHWNCADIIKYEQ